MKKDLATRIQARLDTLGKNPSGVALEAGMGRSSVRDIILGRVENPRIDTLRKLTGPLECTLDYLLGDSDDPGKEGTHRYLIEYDVYSGIVPFAAEAGVFRPALDYEGDKARREQQFTGRKFYYVRDERLPDWEYDLFVMVDNSLENVGFAKGDVLTVVKHRYDLQIPLTHSAFVAVRRHARELGVEEISIRQVNIQKKSLMLVCGVDIIEIPEWSVDNESALLPNHYVANQTSIDILGLVIRIERSLPISQAATDLTYIED